MSCFRTLAAILVSDFCIYYLKNNKYTYTSKTFLGSIVQCTRDSNPGPLDHMSDALTTELHPLSTNTVLTLMLTLTTLSAHAVLSLLYIVNSSLLLPAFIYILLDYFLLVFSRRIKGDSLLHIFV